MYDNQCLADSNYYVDSNGIMVTDKWLKTTSDSGEEEWYYFGSTGKTLDDTWKKISDKWYHLMEWPYGKGLDLR